MYIICDVYPFKLLQYLGRNCLCNVQIVSIDVGRGRVKYLELVPNSIVQYCDKICLNQTKTFLKTCTNIRIFKNITTSLSYRSHFNLSILFMKGGEIFPFLTIYRHYV